MTEERPCEPDDLCLIKDEWGVFYFAMVDELWEDGDVARAHSATGERFNVDRAVAISTALTYPESLACIRALAEPFFTYEAAIGAVQNWRSANT